MTPHLEIAQHLLEAQRFDQAAEEVLRHLAQYPDDPSALTLLAWCHLRNRRFQAAAQAAEAALSADPGHADGFAVLAAILRHQGESEAALEAIQNALSLEPAEPNYLVILASLHSDASRWEEALAASRLAIERDPSHLEAINRSATSLVQLGRVDEAAAVLENALALHPEHAETLTSMGWLESERHAHGRALGFFQRALRLTPDNPWARRGLLRSLRAQYPFYGGILDASLWMRKHSRRLQQQILVANFLGTRLLGELLQKYPALMVLAAPLLLLWRGFCYLSWTARAATTLLLRLNPYGRHLVNREERLESNFVGAFWLAALACWLFHELVDPFVLWARIGPPLFLSLPMLWGGAFDCATGWPRQVAGAVATVLTLAGLLGLVLLDWQFPTAITCLKVYSLGFTPALLAFQLLMQVEPTTASTAD